MESLGTTPPERKNWSCSSAPRTLYYITHPGNAAQKVKAQATESITSLKQRREKTHSNLIFKLITASNNKNPKEHRFYPIPLPHLLSLSLSAASSHPKKANFADRHPASHLKSFLSTAFTKWPFRPVPQESNGLRAHRSQPPQ